MSKLIPCIKEIFQNGKFNGEILLQIIKARNISRREYEVFQVIASDGVNWSSSIIVSSQQNSNFKKEKFKKNPIIKVNEFEVYATMKGTESEEVRYLLIKKFEIISFNDNKIIGDPKELEVSEEADANNHNMSELMSSDQISIIKDFYPGLENWSIKPRIIKKFPIKNWKNNKNSGKVLSFDTMDHSGTIRFTAFNELADKFDNIIEIDKAFEISNGQIKIGNKQYNIASNELEVIISKDTVIEELLNDCDVPFPTFNIIPIHEIYDRNIGEFVDVIGICWRIDDIDFIYSNSKPLRKRDIVLLDDSGSINITMWNEEADEFQYKAQTVLLIQNGRIGEYNGNKYLSITRNSTIRNNPRISENKLYYDVIKRTYF